MLKYGSDCSGIEAPIQALKKLKIPFDHIFSSEIDKHCITSIKANYSPFYIFDDISLENNLKTKLNLDLYVCGFPCQTFSLAGSRKGFEDQKGCVIWHAIKYIKKTTPKVFVLENVKGLLSMNQGKDFNLILETLKQKVGKKYKIFWKVLNTLDFGIPQSRERVFIVGMRNDHYKQKFSDQDFDWKMLNKKKLKPLEGFVDYSDYPAEKNHQKYQYLSEKYSKDKIFIDLCFKKSKFINSDVICPCLNAQGNLFNLKMMRKANRKEYLALQGFPKNFKVKVSTKQLKKQVGNSMSVNVLTELFRVIL